MKTKSWPTSTCCLAQCSPAPSEPFQPRFRLARRPAERCDGLRGRDVQRLSHGPAHPRMVLFTSHPFRRGIEALSPFLVHSGGEPDELSRRAEIFGAGYCAAVDGRLVGGPLRHRVRLVVRDRRRRIPLHVSQRITMRGWPPRRGWPSFLRETSVSRTAAWATARSCLRSSPDNQGFDASGGTPMPVRTKRSLVPRRTGRIEGSLDRRFAIRHRHRRVFGATPIPFNTSADATRPSSGS